MKIKPAFVLNNEAGKLTVVDTKGRVWTYNNNQWRMVTELPEAPEEDTEMGFI